MLIRPLSDLHLEWYGKPLPVLEAMPHPKADLCVLAGDIGSVNQTFELAQTFGFLKQRYSEVVYVPGNHEYYGRHHSMVGQKIPEVAHETGVHYLEPGVRVKVAGREIVGCAMWFPYQPKGNSWANEDDELITDFHVIREFVPWVYNENKRHVEWLNSAVSEGSIVVTHHLPARGSIAPQYAGSPTNKYFLCDMEALIREKKPAVWFHGHTHECFDYQIDATRIVANPLGYPLRDSAGRLKGYLPNGFNAELVIEI